MHLLTSLAFWFLELEEFSSETKRLAPFCDDKKGPATRNFWLSTPGGSGGFSLAFSSAAALWGRSEALENWSLRKYLRSMNERNFGMLTSC